MNSCDFLDKVGQSRVAFSPNFGEFSLKNWQILAWDWLKEAGASFMLKAKGMHT